jgi:hypothetical protein
MISRRHFLTGTAALAAIGPAFGATSTEPGSVVLDPPKIDKPVRPERAASLTRMLAEAKTGARPRFGMTRIDGYVLEKDDVILWGRNEPKQQELIFDDLVIALRAIRGQYGAGTPGVSLFFSRDATPSKIDDIQKSHDDAQSIFDHKDFEGFKRACSELRWYPVVIALQHDSSMAKNLLEADHLLKFETRYATGVDPLVKIGPRFNPLRMTEELQVKVADGLASESEKYASTISSKTFGSMTFVPGRMSYVKDENAVFIDCVQVLLSTRSFTRDTHQVVANPVYQDYANLWSNHMEETIRVFPKLRYMQDVFRTFALARILLREKVLQGMGDKDVLEKYLVPNVSIPDHYEDSKAFVVNIKGKKRTYGFKVCGGVKVQYQSTVPRLDKTPEEKADVVLAGKKAIETCTGASCWKVE